MNHLSELSIFRHSQSYEAGIFDGAFIYELPIAISGAVIIQCIDGEAVFSINTRSYKLSKGKAAFIAFDMIVVPVKASLDFKIRYLSLNFNAANDVFFTITSNRFWDMMYRHPVFSIPDDKAAAFNRWMSQCMWIQAHCPTSVAETALRNETDNFFIILSESLNKSKGFNTEKQSKNRGWAITCDFITLLNRNYTRHHDVAFYSEKLNITPDYLNTLARKNLGMTAKGQINIILIRAIKTLLYTTDMSIKNIAERLGFTDPSYMCRIFRQHSGITPLQYRNKSK